MVGPDSLRGIFHPKLCYDSLTSILFTWIVAAGVQRRTTVIDTYYNYHAAVYIFSFQIGKNTNILDINCKILILQGALHGWLL